MYKKIDFRVRPPFGNYMKMFENDQAHFARLADAFDMTVSESQRTGSLEAFVGEMDQAEIEISVVPCRKELGATGDDFFDLTERYPGRFIIFPYIDPTDGEEALREIDRYRETWDIRGVSAEPTFQPKPYRFDDPVAYPMYEKLQREGLALFVSYSAKLLPVVDPDTVRQLGTRAPRFSGAQNRRGTRRMALAPGGDGHGLQLAQYLHCPGHVRPDRRGKPGLCAVRQHSDEASDAVWDGLSHPQCGGHGQIL